MTAEAGAPDGRTACTVDELLIEARSSLPHRTSPAKALAAQATGALLVDIRGDDQRRTCRLIHGALLPPRNALEWRCDPTGQWRHPAVNGRNQHLILICQEGSQSSLVAATCNGSGWSTPRTWTGVRRLGRGQATRDCPADNRPRPSDNRHRDGSPR